MSRLNTALKYFEENKAYMQAKVDGGIESYRKGTTLLEFVNQNGEPVENIIVEIKQCNHEFRYGANIFMLDEFESEDKNAAYREKFASAFNLATIPFYWDALEPERGRSRFSKESKKIYRRPAPDLCIDYCMEHGIEPKCHCLNYDGFLPKWLIGATVNEHKNALEKRFRELAERYADIIPSWEVTNETFNSGKQSKFYYEDDFVEWSFHMADRYFPKNKLIINDYNAWYFNPVSNRMSYYMQIERLKANGIHHLDSVGIQYHSFFSLEEEEKHAKVRYNPLHVYDVLDLFAKTNQKLQITEITLSAYSNSDEDEEIQAQLLKNMYSIFFSHPAMEAIIYWNLVDGYAAFAPQGDMTAGENKFYGGLVRFDFTEKPAFKALKYLFNELWHTEETMESKNGKLSFRGFYGDYDLLIHTGDKTIPYKISTSRDKQNEFKIQL